jgi:pimeloyl-ACP methyl ester carboxylesterase
MAMHYLNRLLVAAALAIALGIALGGCSLVKLKQESRDFYASTVLVGRIDCPSGWAGPVVVAAMARLAGRNSIAHQTLLHECGGYELIVPKGQYTLLAYGDGNGNGRYDDGEPTGAYAGGALVVAAEMGVVAELDFVIGAQPVPAAALLAWPAAALAAIPAPRHSTQAGALADLDAPAFSAENGRHGYWAPMEFFRETGGNIYFLESYNPQKIPVLFVHGAVGSPQDWRWFFEHLDRRRYQPWFFYYPSGASVESMAYLLYWKLFNLQVRHHFEQLDIVAHSMGGLVVRKFLLDQGNQFPQLKVFVTLSTPWAGEASAELGVKHSPAVVPSWLDMQPEGRFMKALFERRLPPGIDHHLLFGHRGGYSLLRPNNDGTVTLASQLRAAAQAEARMVYGYDEDHDSVLRSPQVLAQVQAILGSTASRADGGPRPGQVQVNFSYEGSADGPRGLPALLLTPVGAAARERQGRVLIALRADDSGRSFGPVPAGLYDASLTATAYRAEPAKLRLQVGAGATPVLDFRFVPQGALYGYVAADRAEVDTPAGSYRPPHATVQISAITLAGAGVQRTLVPRQSGDADLLERYLARQDDAYKAEFTFVDLPAGEYELTVRAQGYRPHTSRHTVVPGRLAPLQPIVLTPTD